MQDDEAFYHLRERLEREAVRGAMSAFHDDAINREITARATAELEWLIDDRPESDWIFVQHHGLDVAQLPRFPGQRELAERIVQALRRQVDHHD